MTQLRIYIAQSPSTSLVQGYVKEKGPSSILEAVPDDILVCPIALLATDVMYMSSVIRDGDSLVRTPQPQPNHGSTYL
jgi:hypothetical protein